jgi:hypothetical protein
LDEATQSYVGYIAKQRVYLDSLIYGNVFLHLPVIVHIKAYVHHIVAKSIEEIPMVQEFADVFPNDLPGMPHERDIEFKLSCSLVLLLSPRSRTK